MVTAVPYTALDQVAGSFPSPHYPTPTITPVASKIQVPFLDGDINQTTLATTLTSRLPTSTLGKTPATLPPAGTKNISMYLFAGGIVLFAVVLSSKRKF